LCEAQFDRMRLACQGHSSQHFSAMRFDVSAQIGKCPAHAHEVVHHDVFRSGLNRTVEFRLSRKTRKAICSGMGNDIHLNHAAINSPVQPLRQLVGKNFGNGVYPVLFVSVRTDQNGMMSPQQRGKSVNLQWVERITHQNVRSNRIARFRRPIVRVLFNSGLAGVYQHVREIFPRSSWRFHAANSITCKQTIFPQGTCHG